MKNFGSDGDSVQVTAPYAVTPGDGMMIGSLFCVSTKTAAQGSLTDAVTIGQFDLPALSTDVFAEGAVAYWDGALRRVSISGGTPIGVVPGGKAAGAATVRVRLTAGASLVSGAGIPVLDAATAGTSSAWIPYVPGMRLAYALDSGSTATAVSLDLSEDGVTSVGQWGTDTWSSSTSSKITQPIWLRNPNVRYVRFNVISGGPLSCQRF